MIACFIYGKYVLYYRGKRNAIHDTEKGWCRYEYSRIIYSLVQQQAFKPGWNCHAESLDDAESAGAGMIQMMDRSMELSVNPSVGSNIDVLI